MHGDLGAALQPLQLMATNLNYKVPHQGKAQMMPDYKIPYLLHTYKYDSCFYFLLDTRYIGWLPDRAL